MLGFVLGILSSIGVIGAAWGGDIAQDPVSSYWGTAGGVLLGGLVIGVFFARTVGAFAMVLTFGAAIAAVITLFGGNPGYTLPLIALSLVCWVLQSVQARRVYPTPAQY